MVTSSIASLIWPTVLRDEPLAGQAHDADGVLRDVVVDASFLSYITGVATYGTTVYEELDGAGRAWLEHGDPAPLLRIAAEQTDWSEAGVPEEFSSGLYVAVICNDYPQLWDITAPLAGRPAQYDAAVADLQANDPNAFAPYTIDDWLASPWTEYSSCIGWPSPSQWVPPVDSARHVSRCARHSCSSVISTRSLHRKVPRSSPTGSRTRPSWRSPTPATSRRSSTTRAARRTSSSSSSARRRRETRAVLPSTRRCAPPTSSRGASTRLQHRQATEPSGQRRVVAAAVRDRGRPVPALVRDARQRRRRPAWRHVHHHRARRCAFPPRRFAMGREPRRLRACQMGSGDRRRQGPCDVCPCGRLHARHHLELQRPRWRRRRCRAQSTAPRWRSRYPHREAADHPGRRPRTHQSSAVVRAMVNDYGSRTECSARSDP